MVVMVAVRPALMRMLGLFQEMRIERQDPLQVEGTAIEHLVQRHGTALTADPLGIGVDRLDARLDGLQLVGSHQVGLVEQDHVGEGDLVLGLVGVGQPLQHVTAVDDGNHRIELGLGAHVLVHEEGLRHRRRIGDTRGLDHDGIEAALALHQVLDGADQVAANGAADAAVVHLEDFLVGFDEQVVVDADLAELVDDHRIAGAVVLAENTVEQRRLAGAEIARQHGDGDLAVLG